jgi:hypothetical protein
MVGLQISINGKLSNTIAVGELGMLSATVEWARLPTKNSSHEQLWVRPTGMKTGDVPNKHVHWEIVPLRVGDEVTIRAIETNSFDCPLPGLPGIPES